MRGPHPAQITGNARKSLRKKNQQLLGRQPPGQSLRNQRRIKWIRNLSNHGRNEETLQTFIRLMVLSNGQIYWSQISFFSERSFVENIITVRTHYGIMDDVIFINDLSKVWHELGPFTTPSEFFYRFKEWAQFERAHILWLWIFEYKSTITFVTIRNRRTKQLALYIWSNWK